MPSINGLLKQALEGEGFTVSINNALYNKLASLTGVDDLQIDGLRKIVTGKQPDDHTGV